MRGCPAWQAIGYGQREDPMKRQLFTSGGAALFVMICLSGNAPAQTTPPSEEIVGDRQEIRQDRDELRQDPRELREDRRGLREDLRSGGNPEQLQEERREIRDDRREMHKDPHGLPPERRD